MLSSHPLSPPSSPFLSPHSPTKQNAARVVTFSGAPVPPSGRAPLASIDGLLLSGAALATAASLPPGLRAGASSPPLAAVNAPALPGAGDGAIAVSAPGGRTFTPVTMVLTQDADAALSASLGLPFLAANATSANATSSANVTVASTTAPGQEGRLVVSCLSPSGARLSAGVVRLRARSPGRVNFPSACAGSAKVVVAPAASYMQVVLDDFAFVPGGGP